LRQRGNIVSKSANSLPMSLESFIGHYGYLALLVGAFVEGETTIVLAGFAAHLGFLELPWVILVAYAGTLGADQLSFFLGRRHSGSFLALLPKHPVWERRVNRVKRLVERYWFALILGFRILYGLRTVTPFVFGMSRISAGYFFLLSSVSALAWAGMAATAGYLFGSALEMVMGDIRKFTFRILGIMAVIVALLWIIHFFRSRGYKNEPS
jgi:membrane protein DedA with SNARE-associated domain